MIGAEYALDVAEYVGDALASTPPAQQIRGYDPKIVVHSTTRERWPLIIESGRLLSASELSKVGQEVRAIGLETFGESAEYREFIHFSPFGKPNGEVVVLSRGLGRVCTDFEAEYVPGARIYLDAGRMIRDGIAVLDGLHVFKVRRVLELERYLVDAITSKDVGGDESEWAPRRFAASADAEFCKRHQGRMRA